MASSRWLALSVALLGAGCDLDFTIPNAGGSGGASTASSTNASSNASTNASTSVASTSDASSTVASSSSGSVPDPLSVYKRSFPLVPGSNWTKSSFASEFGTDPNVPKDGIVAAVKLQLQPVLMLLTSDNMIHMRSSGVWSTTPVDTMFPPPSAACKKDNACNMMGTLPCSPVSMTNVNVMGHVPALGGGCGAGGTNEEVIFLGPSVATDYVRTSGGSTSLLVQRDYKVDCYPDDYPANVNFLWDFEIFTPDACGMQPADPTWFEFYRRMSDGKTHYYNAATPSGQSSGAWADDDPNNPLFDPPPLPANHPVPSQVVAAYFDQSPTPKVGTIVLIAP